MKKPSTPARPEPSPNAGPQQPTAPPSPVKEPAAPTPPTQPTAPPPNGPNPPETPVEELPPETPPNGPNPPETPVEELPPETPVEELPPEPPGLALLAMVDFLDGRNPLTIRLTDKEKGSFPTRIMAMRNLISNWQLGGALWHRESSALPSFFPFHAIRMIRFKEVPQ